MSVTPPTTRPRELLQATRLDPPGSMTVTVRRRTRWDEGLFGFGTEYFEIRIVDCTTTRYRVTNCEVSTGLDLGGVLDCLEARAKETEATFNCDHLGISAHQIAEWRAS